MMYDSDVKDVSQSVYPIYIKNKIVLSVGPSLQKSILRYSVCRCERFVPGSWCASKFWHSQTFRVIVRCAWAFRRSPYGNAILF